MNLDLVYPSVWQYVCRQKVSPRTENRGAGQGSPVRHETCIDPVLGFFLCSLGTHCSLKGVGVAWEETRYWAPLSETPEFSESGHNPRSKRLLFNQLRTKSFKNSNNLCHILRAFPQHNRAEIKRYICMNFCTKD